MMVGDNDLYLLISKGKQESTFAWGMQQSTFAWYIATSSYVVVKALLV